MSPKAQTAFYLFTSNPEIYRPFCKM